MNKYLSLKTYQLTTKKNTVTFKLFTNIDFENIVVYSIRDRYFLGIEILYYYCM